MFEFGERGRAREREWKARKREIKRESVRMERHRESRAVHIPFRGQLLKIPPSLPNKR